MLRRIPILLIVIGAALMATALVFAPMTVQPVNAQCRNVSNCKSCHEIQGKNPVNAVSAWHTDHAAFDFCAVCHGGDGKAEATAMNPEGVTTALADMAPACKSCHADDLDARFQKYAEEIGGDATQVDLSKVSSGDLMKGVTAFSGGSGPAGPGESSPLNAGPTEKADTAASETETNAPPQNMALNMVLVVIFLALALGGAGFVAWNERRLGEVSILGAARALWSGLRREQWSPYAAGVLLGLTCIAAVAGAHHLLGASSAIASIVSTLAAASGNETVAGNMYFRFVNPPGLTWEMVLLFGILVGGFVGALSSGTFRLRWNQDPTWIQVFGPKKWKRLTLGFLGAAVLQYGASLAGGCTSGLAISGGMLLAPAAFVFIAAMFASGIVVALVVFREKY